VEATTAVTEIRRVNHGRGHSYYIDGIKRPGATTVVGNGYPKHLEKWAAEKSAEYAVDHWDELTEMTVTERLRLITGARFADRDAAARRGTEVHRLAHQYMAGEEITVPDELVGHVDAYVAFVHDWEPRELLLETTIAHTKLGYCGTLDMVADLADGRRWLLDLKTTRSGIFRETALQLAAYRYADVYLDQAGEIQPMIPVDECAAVWLRADRSYEIRPVDATPATFQVFLYAKHIGAFADRDDVVGSALTPPNGGSS
jgi:hypothetical protein